MFRVVELVWFFFFVVFVCFSTLLGEDIWEIFFPLDNAECTDLGTDLVSGIKLKIFQNMFQTVV